MVEAETRETRLKRMRMRSMRRGIKEMDLILDAFAQKTLATMSSADLDLYDRLLNENDQDLYTWVTGQVETPAPYGALIDQIAFTLQRN